MAAVHSQDTAPACPARPGGHPRRRLRRAGAAIDGCGALGALPRGQPARGVEGRDAAALGPRGPTSPPLGIRRVFKGAHPPVPGVSDTAALPAPTRAKREGLSVRYVVDEAGQSHLNVEQAAFFFVILRSPRRSIWGGVPPMGHYYVYILSSSFRGRTAVRGGYQRADETSRGTPAQGR